MKNNETLQNDVMDAIKWEPFLKAAEIGVTAKDGVVTLSGKVDSYYKKKEAEEAAKRVSGVKVVIENILIQTGTNFVKEDTDIANEIILAFQKNWEVPSEKLKVRVENGWVTLEGEVEWNYQKVSAMNAIVHLTGVTGVTNDISIHSTNTDEIEKVEVEHALNLNWALANREIDVKVSHNRMSLNGTVHSWYEKEEAERVAWKTPGVLNVINELQIAYSFA